MNEYYVVRPGTQEVQGPFTLDELIRLLVNKYIGWDYLYSQPGMEGWKPIITLPEVECLYSGIVNAAPEPVRPMPPNYLALSILVTIFCCLPVGLVAVCKAVKVDSLWRVGLYREAQEMSDSAMLWSLIALATGLVCTGNTSLFMFV